MARGKHGENAVGHCGNIAPGPNRHGDFRGVVAHHRHNTLVLRGEATPAHRRAPHFDLRSWMLRTLGGGCIDEEFGRRSRQRREQTEVDHLACFHHGAMSGDVHIAVGPSGVEDVGGTDAGLRL
jgi:hypothetical protein